MCISNSRNSTGSDDPVEIDRIGRIVHVRIYHNVLWAHYKAAVFSSLYVEAGRDKVEVEFVHFAEVEANRRLGQIDVAEHKYPYRLLYQGAFESHSVLDRTIKGCADLLEFRGNCVVLPGYYDTSFWAMLVLAKMRGMKVIVCVDSTERDAERFWIREALKSLFFKLCDGAFCYGSQSRQYVAKLGLKPSQIFERCQATNNEELRRLFDVAQNEMPSRSRMWIGYVGRLSSEKNIDCLISAFASLIAEPQFGDWNLLIVGNGSERDRLVDLAAKAVPGRVRFEGGVSWRKVPQYLAEMDVLVLPSFREPWGLVVNEAMVCGVPVIVSDHCGAAHDLVQDGVTGFRFNPHDGASLAEKLRHLMTSPIRRHEMGEAGRRMIASHTPLSASRQMLLGIRSVLHGRDANS